MPSTSCLHRTTRIVCVSDTHNTYPKLPSGDILIHAGDLTNQGSFSELQRALQWLESADFRLKIVVAGNHDITLDKSFYEQYGTYFHNQQPQDPEACIQLLASSSAPSIVYLNHESKTCNLEHEDGTSARLEVFGSPYSPSRGLWAFGYAPEDAAERWAQIPLDVDIVITHTPPKFHCDESASRGPAGCEELRCALWRVRPRLAVCGHVHEGRGVESVLWDLEAPNVRHKEIETFYWNDAAAGTKKQFLVDLTSRSARPLQNDGGKGKIGSTSMILDGEEREVSPQEHGTEYGRRILGASGAPQHDSLFNEDKLIHGSKQFPQSELAENPISPTAQLRPVHTTTCGLGGFLTGRSDVEALAGREGRKETCIVNAAIAGSSWPHPAGKKFNKPIVVDIELPVVAD